MNNVIDSAFSTANDILLHYISYSPDDLMIVILSSNSSYNIILFINYFNLNGYEVVEDCISVFNLEKLNN